MRCCCTGGELSVSGRLYQARCCCTGGELSVSGRLYQACCCFTGGELSVSGRLYQARCCCTGGELSVNRRLYQVRCCFTGGELSVNPGLAGIWEDEKHRRRVEGHVSQITPQQSQERPYSRSTRSETLLQATSQRETAHCDLSGLKLNLDVSVSEGSMPQDISYPAETPHDTKVIEASFLEPHVTPVSRDMQLMKDLVELHDHSVSVDDDSILGSQRTTCDTWQNGDEEEENILEDLSQPLEEHSGDMKDFSAIGDFSEKLKSDMDDDSNDGLWEESFWNDIATHIPQLDGADDIPTKPRRRRFLKKDRGSTARSRIPLKRPPSSLSMDDGLSNSSARSQNEDSNELSARSCTGEQVSAHKATHLGCIEECSVMNSPISECGDTYLGSGANARISDYSYIANVGSNICVGDKKVSLGEDAVNTDRESPFPTCKNLSDKAQTSIITLSDNEIEYLDTPVSDAPIIVISDEEDDFNSAASDSDNVVITLSDSEKEYVDNPPSDCGNTSLFGFVDTPVSECRTTPISDNMDFNIGAPETSSQASDVAWLLKDIVKEKCLAEEIFKDDFNSYFSHNNIDPKSPCPLLSESGEAIEASNTTLIEAQNVSDLERYNTFNTFNLNGDNFDNVLIGDPKLSSMLSFSEKDDSLVETENNLSEMCLGGQPMLSDAPELDVVMQALSDLGSNEYNDILSDPRLSTCLDNNLGNDQTLPLSSFDAIKTPETSVTGIKSQSINPRQRAPKKSQTQRKPKVPKVDNLLNSVDTSTLNNADTSTAVQNILNNVDTSTAVQNILNNVDTSTAVQNIVNNLDTSTAVQNLSNKADTSTTVQTTSTAKHFEKNKPTYPKQGRHGKTAIARNVASDALTLDSRSIRSGVPLNAQEPQNESDQTNNKVLVVLPLRTIEELSCAVGQGPGMKGEATSDITKQTKIVYPTQRLNSRKAPKRKQTSEPVLEQTLVNKSTNTDRFTGLLNCNSLNGVSFTAVRAHKSAGKQDIIESQSLNNTPQQPSTTVPKRRGRPRKSQNLANIASPSNSFGTPISVLSNNNFTFYEISKWIAIPNANVVKTNTQMPLNEPTNNYDPYEFCEDADDCVNTNQSYRGLRFPSTSFEPKNTVENSTKTLKPKIVIASKSEINEQSYRKSIGSKASDMTIVGEKSKHGNLPPSPKKIQAILPPTPKKIQAILPPIPKKIQAILPPTPKKIQAILKPKSVPNFVPIKSLNVPKGYYLSCMESNTPQVDGKLGKCLVNKTSVGSSSLGFGKSTVNGNNNVHATKEAVIPKITLKRYGKKYMPIVNRKRSSLSTSNSFIHPKEQDILNSHIKVQTNDKASNQSRPSVSHEIEQSGTSVTAHIWIPNQTASTNILNKTQEPILHKIKLPINTFLNNHPQKCFVKITKPNLPNVFPSSNSSKGTINGSYTDGRALETTLIGEHIETAEKRLEDDSPPDVVNKKTVNNLTDSSLTNNSHEVTSTPTLNETLRRYSKIVSRDTLQVFSNSKSDAIRSNKDSIDDSNTLATTQPIKGNSIQHDNAISCDIDFTIIDNTSQTVGSVVNNELSSLEINNTCQTVGGVVNNELSSLEINNPTRGAIHDLELDPVGLSLVKYKTPSSVASNDITFEHSIKSTSTSSKNGIGKVIGETLNNSGSHKSTNGNIKKSSDMVSNNHTDIGNESLSNLSTEGILPLESVEDGEEIFTLAGDNVGSHIKENIDSSDSLSKCKNSIKKTEHFIDSKIVDIKCIRFENVEHNHPSKSEHGFDITTLLEKSEHKGFLPETKITHQAQTLQDDPETHISSSVMNQRFINYRNKKVFSRSNSNVSKELVDHVEVLAPETNSECPVSLPYKKGKYSLRRTSKKLDIGRPLLRNRGKKLNSPRKSNTLISQMKKQLKKMKVKCSDEILALIKPSKVLLERLNNSVIEELTRREKASPVTTFLIPGSSRKNRKTIQRKIATPVKNIKLLNNLYIKGVSLKIPSVDGATGSSSSEESVINSSQPLLLESSKNTVATKRRKRSKLALGSSSQNKNIEVVPGNVSCTTIDQTNKTKRSNTENSPRKPCNKVKNPLQTPPKKGLLTVNIVKSPNRSCLNTGNGKTKMELTKNLEGCGKLAVKIQDFNKSQLNTTHFNILENSLTTNIKCELPSHLGSSSHFDKQVEGETNVFSKSKLGKTKEGGVETLKRDKHLKTSRKPQNNNTKIKLSKQKRCKRIKDEVGSLQESGSKLQPLHTETHLGKGGIHSCQIKSDEDEKLSFSQPGKKTSRQKDVNKTRSRKNSSETRLKSVTQRSFDKRIKKEASFMQTRTPIINMKRRTNSGSEMKVFNSDSVPQVDSCKNVIGPLKKKRSLSSHCSSKQYLSSSKSPHCVPNVSARKDNSRESLGCSSPEYIPDTPPPATKGKRYSLNFLRLL
ncbi:unnamed protein product [Timema podura]|uniref:Uncharacterized protein n=1 Tax=Timema podura TaxID=61482 RepID=A0ABN7NY34_TIMPD|nr:unnamed protein product [Timema podura]